jgi:hypothetical protein
MTDLTYTQSSLFTRFYPETPEGEYVWRELAKNNGAASFLNSQAESIISQIRNAGYTVSKGLKCKISIDEILAELED